MIWRFFCAGNSQELAQRQRVAATPGDSALSIDAFEVSDHQHAKVDAGRNAGTTESGIVRLTQLLDPLIEIPFRQKFVQLLVEHMPRRDWQLLGSNPEFSLLLFVSPPQRHDLSLLSDALSPRGL